MEPFDLFFSSAGQLITAAGGGAIAAYGLFRYLGSKWIENKFSQRMEQLRHTQALELQRLRVEIDSLLSGAIKIQDKEFEVLPECWNKLDEAIGQVSRLTSPMQTYPDLDRMNEQQLEEFFSGSRLRESQKRELLETSKKNDKYPELIFWHRLDDVQKAVAALHNYVERNSIFMAPDLKEKFEKSSEDLWSAMVSMEVGHSAKDWKMQREGWEKVKGEVGPLKKQIGDEIYSRLQAHGRR